LFHPTRGFTWEKRGAERVQIRDTKDGFTLLPVVCITGVIGAQLIYHGKTAAVVSSVASDGLLHYEYNEKHWSNEQTTINLWNKVILPYVAAQRVRLGDDQAPVLVLADAFAPHWTQTVRDLVGTTSGIAYVCVPDSLTHVFQPLDVGIIAGIKQSILRRKDEFLETEVLTAVREGRDVMLTRSKPIIRDRVTAWIKDVLVDPAVCSEACCRSGFNRAGITRLLYGEQPKHVDVDAYVPPPTCNDCGEFGCLVSELPKCIHFVDSEPVVLCQGCEHNHLTLCELPF